ncbi:BTB/POZ domain-containing protein 16 isoform X3 [Aquila chrysaetos chrysaetos]|uniref:BTB/POZ domain-containing protein 16 isoform X3 n=1 Tax=Aquila chrysaetos chrysaetos TaxID=223781 RepID=UPI001176788D|nr:BTB/POZ domain-containing protein 16 isoform X3 [Aquila chrysaetos chrysaetos]
MGLEPMAEIRTRFSDVAAIGILPWLKCGACRQTPTLRLYTQKPHPKELFLPTHRRSQKTLVQVSDLREDVPWKLHFIFPDPSSSTLRCQPVVKCGVCSATSVTAGQISLCPNTRSARHSFPLQVPAPGTERMAFLRGCSRGALEQCCERTPAFPVGLFTLCEFHLWKTTLWWIFLGINATVQIIPARETVLLYFSRLAPQYVKPFVARKG